jgi:hypothetical protein
MDSDDYNQHREFVNLLMLHAKINQVHIHVVAHQRKRDGKNKDAPGDGEDIKGSGDIVNQMHKTAIMWRNRKPRHEREGGAGGSDPDALLIIEKQRGRPNWVGPIRLWHDQQSGQFLGALHDQPIEYIKGMRSARTAELAL